MQERYLRQNLVIRKDLAMPTGKVAAMAAHASMSFILDTLFEVDPIGEVGGKFTPDQWQWLTELDPGLEGHGQVSMAKIVLQVHSEEELLKVESDAKAHNLTCYRVIDSGHSHNKPGTFVAIAIGPHWNEDLEPVTGKLRLYR